MAFSSLNPGLLLSSTSSRRSHSFCDITKRVEVSQSRVHRPLVRCGMQGLDANLVLHRAMNRVQVDQPWRRSSSLALHDCLLPSKTMILRKCCRGAVGADNYHASVDGGLPQKEIMNSSTACHAQIHSEPWSMDDEALPSLELSSLSQRDRERSGRLTSAIGLIMGTAVGPGILGLPAATLHAGLIPSSVTIVAVWAYVMASILLVAELSYAVMAEFGIHLLSSCGLP